MISKRASSEQELLLTVDVGMSGVKAGLFTATGACHAQHSSNVASHNPQPGHHELDLHQVWDAVRRTIRELTAGCEKATRIAGMGLSVASPTVVIVDYNFMPLSRALTYSDTRSQAYLDSLCKHFDEDWFTARTGNRITPSLCSAAAMRYHLDKANSRGNGKVLVGHLNSYLVGRLTGEWTIDWTNASYTGLVEFQRPEQWSHQMLDIFGITKENLPRIVPPWESVAGLSSRAACELGLPQDIPIVAGAADTACAAYGVGCVEEGSIFESSGTSGVLTICHSKPPTNKLFMNRSHVVPNRWLSHGAMSATGAATHWARTVLLGEKGSRDRNYSTFEAEARDSCPGANGVVFLPYLLGERTPVWDPNARAVWTGMSGNTTRADLIRAVFESSAYGIRQIIEAEERFGSERFKEILIVGGGATSHFWTQLRADITGKIYLRSRESEAASRGAAALAAVGSKLHGDLDSALPVPSISERVEPTSDAEALEVYERSYQVYASLYPALEKTFGTMSQVSPFSR